MLQNPLSIMRQKITDIMLESNFDENEMIISAIKTKYTKKLLKEPGVIYHTIATIYSAKMLMIKFNKQR